MTLCMDQSFFMQYNHAMTRDQFRQWGINLGLSEDWSFGDLKDELFEQFVNDFQQIFNQSKKSQILYFLRTCPEACDKDQELFFQHLFGHELPYRQWTPLTLKEIFPRDQFQLMQDYLHRILASKGLLEWDQDFNRFFIHETPPLKKAHTQITPLIEKALNKKLEPTYAFLSLYGDQGICPPHRDRDQCQWTLDVCINQDRPWNLYIENQVTSLDENEGVIYSGTDQLHWRNSIHSGGHCHLIFFHFKERA